MWKLLSIFCLLCVNIYADDMYFNPIPHYFKKAETKDIVITQQCNLFMDKTSYDNKMILRAIRYSYLSKYSNNQTLSLDSQGLKIYEK